MSKIDKTTFIANDVVTNRNIRNLGIVITMLPYYCYKIYLSR
jgi:hypothetical protein